MSRLGVYVYLLSAFVCLFWSLPRLSFSGDRSRLLSDSHPVQRRFERYRKEFADGQEVVFLVHCSDPVERQKAADWLAARLRQEPAVKEAFSRIDTPLWPQQGLYFLSPEELRRLKERLLQQRPQLVALARQEWSSLWQSRGKRPPQEGQPGRGELGRPQDSKLKAEFERAIRSRGREPYQSPWGELPPELPGSVELAVNPQTSMVVADWAGPIKMEEVQGILHEGQQKHPFVEWTPAGAAWAQLDDARRGIRIAFQVTLTSVFLVHMFFRYVFGEPKSARLALLSVSVALAWTTAWVALASPQLNLITINFAATLLGLGMDFHIQLLCRRSSPDEDGLQRALQETRWESLTGALAVSLAFATLTLLPYTGVAQLGRITSMGVMLCWLASRSVFPALLRRFQPGLTAPSGSGILRAERWWREQRTPLLLLFGLVTLLSVYFARLVSFDGNLLHMFSARSQTVQMEQAFHSQAGHCGLFVVSLAPDEASMRERVERFQKLPYVARVESLAVWKPPLQPEHRQAVSEVLEAVARLPELGPAPHIDSKAIEQIRRERQAMGYRDNDLGPGPMQDALNAFLGGLHTDLKLRLSWLRRQKVEPQPDWEQIPASWRKHYYRGGSYLIRIYPKIDLWEPAQLQSFTRSLESVDPDVTGQACLMGALLQDLQAAYWEAGRNALAAISILLLLYFRSLRLALLGLAPKLLAMSWMLGAMGCLGLSFNPANVTALPLTLGIGLMFGIQVVHGQCLNQQASGGLFARGLGKPILVSGLSTILGYVSLCTADYPGVASLGVVMALGVGCNLVAALVLMPLILIQD